MKRIVSSFIVVIIIVLLVACSRRENEDQNIVYVGHGDSWIGTYTLTNVDSLYYDSLVIQHLFDEVDGIDETVREIEYDLIGKSMKSSSMYPQQLVGNAYYHVGSVFKSEIVNLTFEDEVELIIRWDGKEEEITLKRLR